eukprot:423692-Pleurochrysis_carterae.AAC.1
MDVRRTGGVMHSAVSEQLGELGGQELACDVAVQCADCPPRGVGTPIEECVERCHEPTYVCWGVGLVLEKLDGFES